MRECHRHCPLPAVHNPDGQPALTSQGASAKPCSPTEARSSSGTPSAGSPGRNPEGAAPQRRRAGLEAEDLLQACMRHRALSQAPDGTHASADNSSMAGACAVPMMAMA